LQIEINKLEDYNTQVEKEKLQAELNFLRAQINPHFLQNCLNFIYSDTRKTNPNAADAVMLLSTIMRYSVADNPATGEIISLPYVDSGSQNTMIDATLRFTTNNNIKNKMLYISGTTISTYIITKHKSLAATFVGL
jgi:two-component system, LytTR family, sensor kinase